MRSTRSASLRATTRCRCQWYRQEARVLLRVRRRYYDGDKAYIKNVVQCDTNDPLPDHFVRLGILHWLEKHRNEDGPAGVRGFHAASTIVNDLVQLGHDANRLSTELLYLVKEGCVIAEHLQRDKLDHGDLVMLSASGLVHLQLMANPEYLAACAEDTYLADQDLAHRLAARIVANDTKGHYSRLTTARNAWLTSWTTSGRKQESASGLPRLIWESPQIRVGSGGSSLMPPQQRYSIETSGRCEWKP